MMVIGHCPTCGEPIYAEKFDQNMIYSECGCHDSLFWMDNDEERDI